MNSYKPHILNLVEICVRKNVTNFILSPGSRNSPLTLALLRHPDIKCYTVTDERSAAFIALGMAQQLQNPVGIVCTSGTATLNYAPAITEAFYQKIQLLILTADRPPEWIDQFDNQSIRQFGIYKENCLGSFQLPVEPEHDDAKWHSDRVVSEAINLTTYPVRGPVHINVPLREPLYPKNGQEFSYNQNVKVIDIINSERVISNDKFSELINVWNKSEKILILAGMNNCDNLLSDILSKFKDSKNIVIISDITSNI
ncbi:MAG: 2-succinyl-5-enolpyruvyl-6-hydroxy-3-cyclohexene-1-carboxylic-acid synthase, partial [Candidatus Sericytochromatia bacterium]|nr:2-succinyl-5-enolpyruvyl-6-hydroxy-3-cyclohexene-1-carboxylic-acid synthase [Candidatus Sericytochromatia bacterium]